MKKTNSQKLSKRLAQYGVLTVAIAGVTNASGQIIYTDVDPDVGGPGGNYALDLNNDGEPDFFIFQSSSFGSLSSLAAVRMFPINNYYGAKTNAIIASIANSFNYPFALNFNDPIASTNALWNSNYQYMDLQYGACYVNSNWCGVTDKYLGLRIEVLNGPGPNDNQTFYGWARLDVNDSSNWLIKDYAYNSTPGASIAAGDTGVLGINDNVFSNIKVIALNKSIGVYNLQENATFKVYNMTGQEVLKGTTDHRDYVIETPTLSSGVYVLELTDTNSKGVIRKKVVLQ